MSGKLIADYIAELSFRNIDYEFYVNMDGYVKLLGSYYFDPVNCQLFGKKVHIDQALEIPFKIKVLI